MLDEAQFATFQPVLEALTAARRDGHVVARRDLVGSSVRTMSPLFGNKEDRAAQAAAAQAESDRLVALPVADLAAEIMPAFGPDGLRAGSGHRQGAIEVARWLLSKYSSSTKYTQPVLGPAIEGLQALEHAGLIESRAFGGTSSSSKTYHATRLGETALAEGSVRQKL